MQIVAGQNISNSAQINPGVIQNSDIADNTITNAKINSAAAIAGSKLNLAATIVNNDINTAAAIVDSKLAQIATASKVSGAALTSLASIPSGAGIIPAVNVPGATIKFGTATRVGSDASGNQTIAHGMGKTPSGVILFAIFRDIDSSTDVSMSYGSSDGTNHSCISFYGSSGDVGNLTTGHTDKDLHLTNAAENKAQDAVVSLDATNITLAWTKTGAPGAITFRILWVAFG